MYNFFVDGVQLPVAPAELSTRINGRNDTIVLMNEGEVNIIKKPGLTDIEFEVLLPNVNYPFSVYPNGFQPATYYLEKLEKLKIDDKPFQFIVNRMMPNGNLLFDTNMTVTIEDYEILESADNGFDVNVRITLKQYRPYGNKKINLKASTTSAANATKTASKAVVEQKRPTTGKETPKTHTVQSGETLWAIAKKYLGDGSKYTELAKLNNISNPNIIKAGQVIKLG
ncbi:LysM peptidoglycan-binding domain-containing protein [Lysinibacillus macroides]|uniref:Peptidoglycan-binding protein n=1 Tax=Lysinibacillus macroides TaxID=33935 RepID=A0A0N0CV80_9BACI|nr:LysM domain-containing protein [Lysinibacillus macroides]KOY81271.1 peptidoglycan-binding protein [Lysinibacillus macroides]QPR68569.1 LysM peptidoglycan-binding domain-containing protein [Lysinibacillus macroides]